MRCGRKCFLLITTWYLWHGDKHRVCCYTNRVLRSTKKTTSLIMLQKAGLHDLLAISNDNLSRVAKQELLWFVSYSIFELFIVKYNCGRYNSDFNVLREIVIVPVLRPNKFASLLLNDDMTRLLSSKSSIHHWLCTVRRCTILHLIRPQAMAAIQLYWLFLDRTTQLVAYWPAFLISIIFLWWTRCLRFSISQCVILLQSSTMPKSRLELHHQS